MAGQRHYRPDQAVALKRLEARRRALGLSLDGWAAAADVPLRTLMRMRADGRGFDRHVRALAFALRTAERQALGEARMMAEDGR